MGRPKHAAVEAVMKERRLKADENNGREGGVFTTSGGGREEFRQVED